MQKDKGLKILLTIYLFIEISLYFIFVILDILGKYNIGYYFKISAIIFNLFYLTLLSCFYFNLDKLFLIAAFVSTLFADYNLLFFNSEIRNITGILCFILVQGIYFIRYHYFNFNKKKFLFSLIYRIVLISLVCILLKTVLKVYDLKINYFALIYFVLLFSNVIDPLINDYKNKKNLFISFSLFLLLLCDLSIGIYNVFLTIPFIYCLEWFFYLPSQVFLFLSTFYRGDKHIKNNH